jgi:hypothetical protein
LLGIFPDLLGRIWRARNKKEIERKGVYPVLSSYYPSTLFTFLLILCVCKRSRPVKDQNKGRDIAL